MGKNVMKLLKPSPSLGKNDFDLSYRSLFSAKFGELLPAYVQETVPNDKIYIKPANLIRALPMVTSPFLRAKQHIDFWFVPYKALWSRFDEFLMDKSEPSSSALNGKLNIPSVNLDYLVKTVNDNSNSLRTDIVGMNYQNGANKLLDMLGYPTQQALSNGIGEVSSSYYVNLWRLAAYNFIWYKEYRQKYYDDGQFGCSNTIRALNASPSYLWNFDFLSCTSAATSYLNLDNNADDYILAMTQMRYRLWKKDLFTGLMPSTQFGNVSTVVSILSGSTGDDLTRWSNDVGTTSFGGARSDHMMYLDAVKNFKQYNANDELVNLHHTHANGGSASFDILALRKSEAIQRWRENSLRAGNQIEDNWNAHYGVKNMSHMITHPTFIGSWDAPLNIGDIDATAQTGTGANQSLASVAGKGITSMDGRSFEFQTSDFGVIIGMWSMLPEAEYNTAGINRMNALLEREDYFFPEYENLGFAPVGGENFMAAVVVSPGTPAPTQPVIGYAPRYWEYKQRFDEVHNSFMHISGATPSDFAIWASPKFDVPAALSLGNQTLPLKCLYVNPQTFDVNFGVNASQSDQFLVDFFFNVEAIRSMSVSGMPSY